MIFSKTSIAKLNPCKYRFYNFIAKYKNKKFTSHQFMGLKHITHQDKLWVAFRMMPKESVPKAAADIAESVLHIYESVYPEDLRPRKAIEAARNGIGNTADAATSAACAGASTTPASTAYAAAYAATYAALTAAYAAAYATSAAVTAADYSAAYAAYSSATIHEKKIRTILLKYLK